MLQVKSIQRYSKKSIPALLKLATQYFNRYIRQRDTVDGRFTCISCGHPKPTTLMHAGHYLSAGHHGAVRFDEQNVHGQCHHCNTFLHGNLLGYRAGLEQKIGPEAMTALELKSQMRGFRWDRYTLIDIITTYQLKCKQK